MTLETKTKTWHAHNYIRDWIPGYGMWNIKKDSTIHARGFSVRDIRAPYSMLYCMAIGAFNTTIAMAGIDALL